MKKFLQVLCVAISFVLFIPLLLYAADGCQWQANGCNYVVIYNDSGGGTASIDCGDGYYEYGSGPVGECPGTEF